MIESILSPPAVGSPLGIGGIETTPLRPAAPAAEPPGVNFGAMLGELFTSTSEALRQAETISVAGIKGQATVQQVVEAVMTAEQSLQSAIAVRDKVVGAYLEISRMQI